MSAHFFKDQAGLQGVIHLSDIYRYQGWTFEFHRYAGPIVCRKDMEPASRQPGPKSRFWEVLEAWQKLDKEQKEETRVYG